jgi:bifunctional non-homologous end joining protein LigD
MKKLPRISPLTLTRRREPFDHPDWVFELKHDGFRAVAYISEGECKLVSRRGNVFTRLPALHQALSKLTIRNAILDGEIICLDETGVSRFNALLFRRGQPYFYAFDLLWLNGHDLRSLRLLERKERLKKLILKADSGAVLYADHIDGYGVDFFRMTCEKNLEGTVAKHRASHYDASAKWIKIKNPAYTQKEGRHELFESFYAKSERRTA